MLKRKIQVLFKVNETEYFQLHRTAQQAGLTVSGFIRKSCFSEGKVIVIDRRIIRDVYKEMNAIGNNINQIARVANSCKSVSRENFEYVESALDQIWRIVDEKLGGIKR